MTVIGIILLKIFLTCFWTLSWIVGGTYRSRTAMELSDWLEKNPGSDVQKLKTVFITIPILFMLVTIVVLPYAIIWWGF